MLSNNMDQSLFLFAHQDDEFGVFSQIESEVNSGRRVFCVYVTDGAATVDPRLREQESRVILEQLGIMSDCILFIGRELAIGDGFLYANTDIFTSWLNSFLSEKQRIVACFVPAWEGGHPDHDLLHALAIRVFASRESPSIVQQYSLYNAHSCMAPFFRILTPLPDNGPINQTNIPWHARIRYLRYCLSYRSQWRSWIGLFPLMLINYIRVGKQKLQPVSIARLSERPHSGTLYYEARGFMDWSTLHRALNTSTHSHTIQVK